MHKRLLSTCVIGSLSLLEVLMVVTIVGVLAAVVVPQFTRASALATEASLRSQLQSIRTQVQMYQIRNGGRSPDLLNRQWGDLVSGNFITAAPGNPFHGDSTQIAARPAPGIGWVWDGHDIYAVGPDGHRMIN